MNDRVTYFTARRLLALAAALMLALAAHAPHTLTAAPARQPPQWRDTGIAVPDRGLCFDSVQPEIVLIADESGTSAYNRMSGQRTPLNERPFQLCGPGDLLFAIDQASGAAWRFSPSDPRGRSIAHMPSHIAQDGTVQVYSLGHPTKSSPGHLWASADGGLTWQERGQQFGGRIESLALAEVDARAIYVTVVDRSPTDHVNYAIYFSPDAGVSWQKRYEQQATGSAEFGGPYIDVEPIHGHAAPVGTLKLVINQGYPGSSNTWALYTSGDGARSFSAAGTVSLGQTVQMIHTQEGIVRLVASNPGGSYALTLSTDGGGSWQPLPNPPAAPSFGQPPTLVGAPNEPANVFICQGQILWYSADGGRVWQQIADALSRCLDVAPYEPLTLVDIRAGHLYTLDLPEAGKGLTLGALPNGVSGGAFFAETNHNLSGLFKRYWEAHGGLAQFGYPRTEPFREVNPADGKTYIVQYFERNRFEYHPELAGTPYELSLGLLGNQFTESRRANGEPPFLPIADPKVAGQRYFPATGHTLRDAFKSYWERNGGLAIYGYPISEQFEEVNSEDGKSYTVQYFERARFEYHPENQGTRYEVLLGLLGNKLLREKGWMS